MLAINDSNVLKVFALLRQLFEVPEKRQFLLVQYLDIHELPVLSCCHETFVQLNFYSPRAADPTDRSLLC